MKTPRRALVGMLVSCAAGGLAAAPPVAAEDATFTDDVAPILFEHCGSCHRPEGIGPMSLLTYSSARPWARAIAREVSSRRMPPFHARGSDFALKHDVSLSDEQIDTVTSWVEAGAPRGESAMPQAPDYAAAAAKRPQPDLVLEFEQSFPVPPGSDLQRAFTIENDLGRDLWVRGVDYEPDLNPVVHHMFVFTDPSGLARRYQKADPGIGFLASVDGGDGTDKMMEIFGNGGGGLGGWAPGAGVVIYPEGVAQLLPAGTDLVLQYHYWNSSGETLTHTPKIGLFLSEAEPDRVLEFGGPSANDHIDIRAGDGHSEHWGDWTTHEDLDVVGVMPHMHFLGKSMRITMTEPDGRERLLVDVPSYDFEWQTVYQFEEPIPVRAGTRFDMVAVFDNRAENPRNVLDPPRLVTFGERSDDEMADGILLVARERGRGSDTPLALAGNTAELEAGGAMDALVRFAPNGIPGVTLIPDEYGKGWTYFQSELDEATAAGVALEDPLDLRVTMPYDELVYILEGEVELSDSSGRRVTLGPGQAAVLPKGVEIGWRHDEPLRKYWVTWDHLSAPPDSFVLLDLERDLSELPLDGTRSRNDTQYEIDDTVWVGLWENEPGPMTEPEIFPYSELMIVFEGVATLVDANGREGKLKAGDAALMPAGVPARWRTDEPFRKLYVSFDPVAEEGSADSSAP